jgi:hypothetical protein
MINKHKLLLRLLVALASVFLSLISTYIYFEFFQYDRYYKGTIARVEKTEIAMIEGLASIKGIGSLAKTDINSFAGVFSALENKLAVTITQSGELVYSNIPKEDDLKLKRNRRYFWKKLKNAPRDFPLLNSNYVIHVDTYIPPKWSSKFIRWIKRPQDWFTSSNDFITIPFLMLSVLFYWILFALCWSYNSEYLEDKVLKYLEKGTGDLDA